MSDSKKLTPAANSASYPTLSETGLGRRAFLVGAGAAAAVAFGCGGLFEPDSVAGGLVAEPWDASQPPDASRVPDDLAGGAPLEPQDAGGEEPPDVP